MKAEKEPISKESVKINDSDLKEIQDLLKSANYCYECNRCVNVCPVSIYGIFFPRQLVRDFSNLPIEEVMENSNIWNCITCGQCIEYCPMSTDEEGVSFLDIILKLRKIASENETWREDKLSCTLHGRAYTNIPKLMANDEVEFVNKFGFIEDTELKIAHKGEIAYFIGCLPFLDKVSPCNRECPAGTDVQSYVTLIREGKFREALEVIRKKIPLPGVCGRVCPAPCEEVCNRINIDSPIAIRALKRFVADWELKNEPLSNIEIPQQRDEKVAIVGSGPSGLAAAYYLAKKGYKTTIFEASQYTGGMLRLGIPEYRLPDDILDYEIEYIKKHGVEIKTKTPIGPDLTFNNLKKQEYKAIYLSIGLQSTRKMNIPGEDLKNVISGLDFLRKFKILAWELKKQEINVKNKIIGVVGGGNVAMDSARTCLRLGAKKVIIIYRRSRKEMPASDDEIEMAEEEGIEFHFLTNPVKLYGDKTEKLKEVECIRMELGEPDESGRRRPIPIEGSEFKMKLNVLMLAIGQVADPALIEAAHDEFKLNKWGNIETDPLTLETNLPGVFAGGDIIGGEGIVVKAIANGHEAANSIDRYLRGEDLKEGRITNEILFPAATPKKAVSSAPREIMDLIPAEERSCSFDECELGLTEEEAIREAERCLMCNLCCNCDLPPDIGGDQKFECFYGPQVFSISSEKGKYIRIPTTVIGLLNQNDITPVVLENEKCCGHDAYWAGDFDTFEKLARYNIELYKNAGVKKIIFNCAEGYHMWKYVYKEFFDYLDDVDYDFEVYHTSEYILKERLLENLKIPPSEVIKVTYHDPCRLGRFSRVYDPPREILTKIPYVELIEMKSNRNDALCCGVSANINCNLCSKLIQEERINEAVETGAKYLIVTCPKCLTHFNCYLNENPDINLKVVDLMNFIGMLYRY